MAIPSRLDTPWLELTTMAASCASCRATLPPQARFCSRCGAPAGRGASRRLSPGAAAAGAAVAVLLAFGLVMWRGGAVPQASAVPRASGAGAIPPAASAPAASMPDISRMSPRERFDRLYGRVMQGLRAGDTEALSRFAPMALAAYEMLDSADVDSSARRQVALLRLHLGDTTAAWPPRPR